MKLTLNEVKAMNEVAGTQLTKEQEIAFIKDRLQELEFGTQKAFDTYKKSHNMRPDTKVKVAGKNTTVAQASKNSGNTKPKGTSVFGGKKDKSISDIKMDSKVDVSVISKSVSQNLITKDPLGKIYDDAVEVQKRLNKGESGVYTRTSPNGGEISFKDGPTFDVYRPYNANKTKDTKIYASKK